jgi:predicted XRE-type DNA-binding protein
VTDTIPDHIEITAGSGNVFADVGIPNPEVRLLKAELSLAVRHLIEERHITQKEAARLLNTEQPRISDILHGRVRGFSIERLLSYVTALDCDVQIQIVPRRKGISIGVGEREKTHVQMV